MELAVLSEEVPYSIGDEPVQIVRWQAGKKIRIKNNFLMACQSAAGLTYFTLPPSQTEYGDTVYTHASSINHVTIDTATNMQWFEFLSHLAATAGTIFLQYAKGGRPTVDRTATKVAALFVYYDDFLAGYLKQDPPKKTDANAAATTVENTLKGHCWKDTSAGTKDMHWTKLRMYFYAAGLQYAGKLIQTSRIEVASQAQTIFDQQIYLIMARVALELFFKQIARYGQSAFAIDCLGIAQGGQISTKQYAELAVKPPFDKVWYDYVAQVKLNMLNGVTGVSQYSSYTDNPLVDTLITGTEVQNIIYELKETFVMPVVAIDDARKFWGIGVYDEKKHFANLLIGAVAGDVGSYSEFHGTSKYALGLESAIHLQMMRELKKWEINKTIEKALSVQDHYHFDELKPLFVGMFTNYQFGKTLQGFCDSEAFYGAHIIARYQSISSGILSTETVTDLQNCHSSNTLKVGRSNYQNMLLALLYIGSLTPNYGSVHFPNGITEGELESLLYFTQMFWLTSSTNWQDQRFFMTSVWHLEVYDCVNPEVTIDWAKTSTIQKRHELVLDAIDQSEVLYIALKYNHGYVVGKPIFEQLMSEPRPYGERKPSSIGGLGFLSVRISLSKKLWPLTVKGKKGEKPIPDKKEPDKKEQPKADKGKEPKENTKKPAEETDQELAEATA